MASSRREETALDVKHAHTSFLLCVMADMKNKLWGSDVHSLQ